MGTMATGITATGRAATTKQKPTLPQRSHGLSRFSDQAAPRRAFHPSVCEAFKRAASILDKFDLKRAILMQMLRQLLHPLSSD